MATGLFALGAQLGAVLGLLPLLVFFARQASRLSLVVVSLLGAAAGGIIGAVLGSSLGLLSAMGPLTHVEPFDVVYFLCGLLAAGGIGLIVGDAILAAARRPGTYRRLGRCQRR